MNAQLHMDSNGFLLQFISPALYLHHLVKLTSIVALYCAFLGSTVCCIVVCMTIVPAAERL